MRSRRVIMIFITNAVVNYVYYIPWAQLVDAKKTRPSLVYRRVWLRQTMPANQSMWKCSDTQVSDRIELKLPSSSNFADILISREVATLKEDVRNIKTDIASCCNRPTACFSSDIKVQFGQTLKDIKEELSYLCNHLNRLNLNQQHQQCHL